jgi:hypothetical protein
MTAFVLMTLVMQRSGLGSESSATKINLDDYHRRHADRQWICRNPATARIAGSGPTPPEASGRR